MGTVLEFTVGPRLYYSIDSTSNSLLVPADLLIPPFFKLVRASDIPTTLRTSALSLLADCVNTYSLAVLAYAEDLAGAMVDLLQTESVPVKQDDIGKGEIPKQEENSEESISSESQQRMDTMDNTPTAKNSKFPPLRRAALHFLGLLAREATQYSCESLSKTTLLSQEVIQRARVTLAYISSTDVDSVVRVMAREVHEGLEELVKARLGL